MRLAFFNATRNWGGVKTWTLEFANALRERGHDISVHGRAGAFIERAEMLGLDARAEEFGPDYNPMAITRFARMFKREKIDAVLVNVGRDLRTAGIAAKLCHIPLVQRVGLPGDMKNVWKVRALHHWVRPHYLCPCHFNRDGLLQNLPFIPQKDTTVIHSAKIPVEAISRPSAPLRFVTTSQLNPDKGHIHVLHALAELKKQGYNFHWDVAGTGRSEQELHTAAQALGVANNITWHGWTQNVKAILTNADIFLLPSLSEGLPNTLLEAMAAGLVPVARNVGGVAEVWPKSITQFLLPPAQNTPAESEAQAFTIALNTLLAADDDQLLAWKDVALQQCINSFSLEKQAQKLELFFTTITSGKKPAQSY